MALHNGSEAARSILNIVDYLYPISIALYYLIAVTLSMSMLQKPKTGTTIARMRIVATILLVLVILTYIGQVAIYLTRLIQHGWWATEQDTIQMVASLFVWAILYVRLIGTKAQVWHPYLGSWVLGLGFEAACALLSRYGVAEISIYDKLVLALDGINQLRQQAHQMPILPVMSSWILMTTAMILMMTSVMAALTSRNNNGKDWKNKVVGGAT